MRLQRNNRGNDGYRYCDYCNQKKDKYVSKSRPDNYIDICSDCVLEIYELMKKEILC